MSHKLTFFTRLRILVAISTIVSTGFLGSFGTSMAQFYESTLDAVETRAPFLGMEASLSSALVSGKIGGKKLADRRAIQVFYGARNNQPYWAENARGARVLLQKLENSWTHGLNPDNYHTEEIRSLLGGGNFLRKAELELLLTDAFLRYTKDLSGMRISPEGLRVDADSWLQPLQSEVVFGYLDSRNSLNGIFKAIEPQGRTYKLLQEELVRLSKEDEPDYSAVLPIEFGALMKPNWRHERIPDLRTRLGVTQHTEDPYLYDDSLAAAVMKFQSKNGLLSDGIIGSNTLQFLNHTNQHKILQIIANLERLRWVDSDRPDKFVVVNIPSATLWALDRGRVQFEMSVIVGSPARPTESFTTGIQGVRFNPDWTIPTTIKRYDILPKVKKDPEYLLDKGIELIRGRGAGAETLDPSSIDWDKISIAELYALRMVQIPGDHNPLGRVRILMPNKYNIYLHDTNHPELFDRPQRALSSGCIRLSDPQKMAEFVMRAHPDWDGDAQADILKTYEKTDIKIEQSIPVYILYYTAWIDNHGRVTYGPDIYNQDRKLIEKLKKIDGFRIPGHNGPSVGGSRLVLAN